ncbi:MAG: phage tail assembly chaperone [Acidimicrobiales bacterium]
MADPITFTADHDHDNITDAEIELRMRNYRTKLLAESDWTQLVDSVVADQAAWATYRQALRDAPESWTVPTWTPPDPPA